MNSELQSVASKFKETETRLSSLQSELSGIAREKESVKSKFSERAHKSWTSVLNKKEKFHVRNIWTVLFYNLLYTIHTYRDEHNGGLDCFTITKKSLLHTAHWTYLET